MGNWFRIILSFSLGMATLVGFAQPANDNCANAIGICAGTPVQGNNMGATLELGAAAADGNDPTTTYCFTADNTVWFTFTTNAAGGDVTVTVNNINCIATPGFGNALSGVIINPVNPCDANSYGFVSNCETGATTSMTLNATGLAPNSTFYVVIDGDLTGANTNAAECDFSLLASGPGVEVTATTTVVDENCGANDGQITVDAVSGGQPPYSYALNGGAYQASNQFPGLSAGTYTLTVQDAAGCVYVISPTIDVAQTGGPTGANPVASDASCNNADGSLDIQGVTGGTGPYTYSLNGGAPQGSSVFNNVAAGSYTVTVTDASGCELELTNVLVGNSNGPTGATTGISNASCGNADGSITIQTVSGGTSPYSYSLNGGAPQAGNTFNGLAAGNYNILITDAGGCTFNVNVTVGTQTTPQNPSVQITGVPSPACSGSPVMFTANVNNGSSAGNYEWFVNGVSVQNGPSNTFTSGTPATGDQVYVVFTSSDPCVVTGPVTSNMITVTVLPSSTPTVDNTTPNTTVCAEESVVFTATTTGCNPSSYTFMVNGNPVQTGPDSVFSTTALADGDEVSVTVECGNPCAQPSTLSTSPITMDVTTIPVDAGPDYLITAGQSVDISGSGLGTPEWIPPTDLSDPFSFETTASPDQTTTYFLTVTANGCTATDEMLIRVKPIVKPPTAFSPNGDGINDVWEIPGIANFPDCKVNIYDRWGQRVFSSSGYASPWDGTNGGRKIPVATYYYVIDLDQTDEEVGRAFGAVTILK